MAGCHCPALGRGRLIHGAEGSPCCRRGFTELRAAVPQGNSSGAAWRGPLVCGLQVWTRFHLDNVSSRHVASLWLLSLCAVAESVAPGQGETQGRSARWSNRRGCENHPEGHQGSLGSSGCPREEGTTGLGMRSGGGDSRKGPGGFRGTLSPCLAPSKAAEETHFPRAHVGASGPTQSRQGDLWPWRIVAIMDLPKVVGL